MLSHDGVQWTAAGVAGRLGVSPATLRTWSRRYGIGPVDHVPGRHRRYTASDVARLEMLCALVADGMAPASAARAARQDVESSSPPVDDEREPPSEIDWPAAVRGIISAVLRLDDRAVRQVVEHRLRADGVIRTWERLCVPALVEVGRHNGTGMRIDAEHLFSVTLSSALSRVTGSTRPGTGRGVLIGCPSGERHTLAIEALRAALAERRCPVRLLGADLPLPAWVEAVRRTRPGQVALWAQTERTARTSALARLRLEGTGAVLALGPGWEHRRLPSGVLTSDTLHAAADLILAGQRKGTPPTRDPITAAAVP